MFAKHCENNGKKEGGEGGRGPWASIHCKLSWGALPGPSCPSPPYALLFEDPAVTAKATPASAVRAVPSLGLEGRLNFPKRLWKLMGKYLFLSAGNTQCFPAICANPMKRCREPPSLQEAGTQRQPARNLDTLSPMAHLSPEL